MGQETLDRQAPEQLSGMAGVEAIKQCERFPSHCPDEECLAGFSQSYAEDWEDPKILPAIES